MSRQLEAAPVYKIAIHQKLRNCDEEARKRYSAWFCSKFHTSAKLIENIWFSYETFFHLDDCVNSQNYRLWSTELPKDVSERPLHKYKCIVWWAITHRVYVRAHLGGRWRARRRAEMCVCENGSHLEQMLQMSKYKKIMTLATGFQQNSIYRCMFWCLYHHDALKNTALGERINVSPYSEWPCML